MTAPTRVAGWGTAADGAVVTWTVSEGRKGRRWREVVTGGRDVIHALLLETDPDGRFSHLELARADGLWTFHPEADGTLHGNHVDRSDAGVRHIGGWRFAQGDVLVVEGSPLSHAAVAAERRASVPVGGVAVVGAVVVESGGGLHLDDALRIERIADDRWRIGEWQPVTVDAAGLPVLAGGQRRPLELG
jgi:hypothetical protein